jgi:hypothetical protein
VKAGRQRSAFMIQAVLCQIVPLDEICFHIFHPRNASLIYRPCPEEPGGGRKMPIRFWIYLSIEVLMMAFFATMSALLMKPDVLRNIPEPPVYVLIGIAVAGWGIMRLLGAIQRKIKKIDSEASEEANKSLLKHYKVIDRISIGFACLFLVSWVIYEIRTWVR